MPELVIKTNVLKGRFPENFIAEMTAILAETLGKPTKYISITVVPGLWMSFGGTEDPCANCSLTCIGKLGEKENIGHAGKVMEYLYKALDIQKDRMYLSFHDSKRSDMGFSGTTFAAL